MLCTLSSLLRVLSVVDGRKRGPSGSLFPANSLFRRRRMDHPVICPPPKAGPLKPTSECLARTFSFHRLESLRCVRPCPRSRRFRRSWAPPSGWRAPRRNTGTWRRPLGCWPGFFFKPDSWTGFAGKAAEGQKCMVHASRPKVTHPRCFFIQQR